MEGVNIVRRQLLTSLRNGPTNTKRGMVNERFLPEKLSSIAIIARNRFN